MPYLAIALVDMFLVKDEESGAVFHHASSWFVLVSILHGDIEFALTTYSFR